MRKGVILILYMSVQRLLPGDVILWGSETRLVLRARIDRHRGQWAGDIFPDELDCSLG